MEAAIPLPPDPAPEPRPQAAPMEEPHPEAESAEEPRPEPPAPLTLRPEPEPIGPRQLICEAIAWRLELKLYFENARRLVEPYLYGRDAEGREWLVAYQLEGDGGEGWLQLDVTDLPAAASLSYRLGELRTDPPSPRPEISEIYGKL